MQLQDTDTHGRGNRCEIASSNLAFISGRCQVVVMAEQALHANIILREEVSDTTRK
jgi:hypothetical protein